MGQPLLLPPPPPWWKKGSINKDMITRRDVTLIAEVKFQIVHSCKVLIGFLIKFCMWLRSILCSYRPIVRSIRENIWTAVLKYGPNEECISHVLRYLHKICFLNAGKRERAKANQALGVRLQ